jgi:glycosyltransferase involved in cell wall biosynthesis
MIWSRGVDTELFRPRDARALDLPRPIFLYVGRLAVEKNLDAFLSLDLPGSKVVVGDGPLGQKLRRQYPQAVFLGFRSGEALAAIYATADAFMFPSRTDTFGIVLLEALASGLPVAAFPVRGPADVIAGHRVGVLDDDLRAAALAALSVPKAACRDFAVRHSWKKSAEEFLANVLRATGSPKPVQRTSELRPSVAAPR